MGPAMTAADGEAIREPEYRVTWISTQFARISSPAMSCVPKPEAALDPVAAKKKRGRPPKNTQPIDEFVVHIPPSRPDPDATRRAAVCIQNDAMVVSSDAPPRKIAKHGGGEEKSTLDSVKTLIRYISCSLLPYPQLGKFTHDFSYCFVERWNNTLNKLVLQAQNGLWTS